MFAATMTPALQSQWIGFVVSTSVTLACSGQAGDPTTLLAFDEPGIKRTPSPGSRWND
jgi:hypothetical protein